MLTAKQKLDLQREASGIKKQLAALKDVRQRLALQKRWSEIIKQLKGVAEQAQAVTEPTVSAEQAAIDDAANQAATSPLNDLPDPTPGQQDAGNYKKGRVTFAGFDIAIENPAGSTRSGVSPQGVAWSTTMHHHYGDFTGSKGADGDAIDVFLGPVLDPTHVFVIDQINPAHRTFDEHKVMLGFASLAEAKAAYFANYDAGWKGLGAITAMSIDEFRSWLNAGQQTAPVKYKQGSLPEVDFKPVPPPELDPAEYEMLSPLAVKQKMLLRSEQGYSDAAIVEVMAHWLDKNIQEGQYTRTWA